MGSDGTAGWAQQPQLLQAGGHVPWRAPGASLRPHGSGTSRPDTPAALAERRATRKARTKRRKLRILPLGQMYLALLGGPPQLGLAICIADLTGNPRPWSITTHLPYTSSCGRYTSPRRACVVPGAPGASRLTVHP